MKQALKYGAWATTALVLSIAMVACNSDSAPSQAGQSDQGVQAWALQYKGSCAQGSDQSSCIGSYGIQMNADGTYDVGPGPQGQHSHGKMDTDDFKALNDAASGLIAHTPAAHAQSCNEGFGASDDYTLTLMKHQQKVQVLSNSQGNLCSTELDDDAAVALHNEVVQLAQKYYPTPFPDACADAASAVEALYPAVQHCRAATDCGYLNADYTPVQANTESQVTVDDCTVVANLPVANLKAMQKAQSKIQSAFAQAQQACANRTARNECSGVQSFMSSSNGVAAAAPVCQQGVCRVNPAALPGAGSFLSY